MREMKMLRLFAVLLAFALGASACGGDDGESSDGGAASEAPSFDDPVEIDYWLWDGNQQPFYEQCAADFQANVQPNITVNISQFGWGDYWTGLTAAFASDSAPDVFTDHLARYPEFVESGVLVDLNPFVERDGVDVDQYFPGLAELWTSPDGRRFGLPKDFDTIAMVLNDQALADAGITADDFANAEWNPQDGGTWGELIQRLTIDANGVRGNEDGFDGSNVEVYGFGLEGNFGAFGQTTFSSFAATNGYSAVDEVWADSANFGDPALAETVQFFADWIAAGYVTPIEDVQSLGGSTIYANGNAATMTNGSWTIGGYVSGEVPTTFAPLPIGPNGERRSMFNGLADSITQSSENPEAAWEWVKYMASADCQNVVGEGAVVFPAIPSAATIAQEAHAANGVDVSAFTIHVDEGTTFLFPITDSASRIEEAVGPAMEQILRGEAVASEVLPGVGEEVNTILGG